MEINIKAFVTPLHTTDEEQQIYSDDESTTKNGSTIISMIHDAKSGELQYRETEDIVQGERNTRKYLYVSCEEYCGGNIVPQLIMKYSWDGVSKSELIERLKPEINSFIPNSDEGEIEFWIMMVSKFLPRKISENIDVVAVENFLNRLRVKFISTGNFPSVGITYLNLLKNMALRWPIFHC